MKKAALEFLGLVLIALVAWACSGSVYPSTDHRLSVVQLKCWHGTEILPCCNAFAVRRPGGALTLVTAAHCLKGLVQHEKAYYADGSGTPLLRARVALVDWPNDRAWLTPDEPEALAPLEVGPGPPEGAEVTAVSPWGVLVGFVLIAVENRYTTTLDVQPGWSGSPVIDSRGRVVGVATECLGWEAGAGPGKSCQPHTGRFIALR